MEKILLFIFILCFVNIFFVIGGDNNISLVKNEENSKMMYNNNYNSKVIKENDQQIDLNKISNQSNY